jgi:hypothetical protein
MNQYIDNIELIFIHVPKTGGSFLEGKLQILAKKYKENRIMGSHFTINHCLDKIDKYNVFGVVRNPYDRIMSAYNMFVRNSWSGVINNTYIKLNEPKTFETFIENLYILFKNKELPWQNVSSNKDLDKVCSSSKNFAVHIVPQFYYFLNHENKIGIKKENILRYESLDKDIKIFLNNNYKDNKIVNGYFKCKIIKHIKIKKKYNIPNIYPKLANMIYEIYENDFIYFNY